MSNNASPLHLLPDDGIAAVPVESGDHLEIRMAIVTEGKLANSQLLFSSLDEQKAQQLGDPELPLVYLSGGKEAADQGEAERTLNLLEALARFLNTGGSWNELRSLLSQAQRAVPCHLEFPGWELIASHRCPFGFVHAFRQQGTQKVVRWLERVEIAEKTLDTWDEEWLGGREEPGKMARQRRHCAESPRRYDGPARS